MNLDRFPRRRYIKSPTALHPLTKFSKLLGGPSIYIKRDDLLPGTAGGNKTRKLEFVVADALKQGADTLITCGAIQSNHCRLTLWAAIREGMPCHLVLEERVPDSFDANASGNHFLYQLLGVASITVVAGGTNMSVAMDNVAASVRSAGGQPYIVPGGASNAIGALGYVSCAQELLSQLADQELHIDHIVVPSGSAGTHAGMVVGLQASDSKIPVSGINVSRTREVQEPIVAKLANETAQLAGLEQPLAPDAIRCYEEYVGAGYSVPTESMVEAVTLLAQTEGILLDPVYSGKTMAGLIDLIRKGVFSKDQNILFLHTGGSPALYAYSEPFNQAFHTSIHNKLNRR